MLLNRFYPWETADSVFSIDYEKLYRLGYRGIHSGHKPADQIGFVAGVTVPQQIKAKDALAQAVLCLADHLIGGAFQH